jgi:hypothetical protein
MLQRDMNIGRSLRSSQWSVASFARLSAQTCGLLWKTQRSAGIARGRTLAPLDRTAVRHPILFSSRVPLIGSAGSELVLVCGRLPRRQCQRLPENSNVQPEAPVAYVPQVQLEALFHEIDGRCLAAEAIHLSPPADAGFHVISKCIVGHDPLIFGVVGDRMRPRPHQRHAAAEHIEELRQFVDARSPKPATHAGDARIVPGGLANLRTVLEDAHRAEFEDPKRATVEAVACLGEEHRPFGIELDQQHRGEQVDAGRIEPVPASNSLLTGKRTGNFQ